jgi:hypothetical protein
MGANAGVEGAPVVAEARILPAKESEHARSVP